MSFDTGQSVRVRASGRDFPASVLLVGDERDLVLQVEGEGVHRFALLGKRWRATDESRWTHGEVDLVASAPAPERKAAGGRRRSGW